MKKGNVGRVIAGRGTKRKGAGWEEEGSLGERTGARSREEQESRKERCAKWEERKEIRLFACLFVCLLL